MTYSKVPGRALDWSNLDSGRRARLVRGLQPILESLAAFPTSRAKRLGVRGGGAESWRREMFRFYHDIKRRVYPVIPPTLRIPLDRRLSEFLADDQNFKFKPTLLHTDLHSQHVLWTGDEVTGVIDWGDALIGDPAREFVQWAAHFGTKGVSAFARNRVGPDDRTFARRVETYRLFRPLWRLRESTFSDNLPLAKDGVNWLRRALAIDPSEGGSR
jgi:aminoglycoside 2''-phosphotransferase